MSEMKNEIRTQNDEMIQAEKRLEMLTHNIIDAAFKIIDDLAALEPTRETNKSTLRRIEEAIISKYGAARLADLSEEEQHIIAKLYDALG